MQKRFSIGVKYKSLDNALYNAGEPIHHGQALPIQIMKQKVSFVFYFI